MHANGTSAVNKKRVQTDTNTITCRYLTGDSLNKQILVLELFDQKVCLRIRLSGF